VSNVSFEGQTEDVPGIWKNHHMLVLRFAADGTTALVRSRMIVRLRAAGIPLGGRTQHQHMMIFPDAGTSSVCPSNETLLTPSLQAKSVRASPLTPGEEGRSASSTLPLLSRQHSSAECPALVEQVQARNARGESQTSSPAVRHGSGPSAGTR